MDTPKGYFRLFTLRNVPVFLHWTFPTGGLILASFVGFDLYKVVYYTFAYVLLILIHEAGHMLAARIRGLKVYTIKVTGLGGECMVQQMQTIRDVVIVYSAGMLAELMVLVLTIIYVNLFGFPSTVFGQSMMNTFTFVNVIMILGSLIPYRVKEGQYNDGYALWCALLDLFKERPEKLIRMGAIAPVFSPETSLLSMDEFRDDDFSVGIEILNDNTTPMQFVVDVLMKYFDIKEEDAIKWMVAIHSNGGVLYPTETMEQAEVIANGITTDVKEKGHYLICRAVSK